MTTSNRTFALVTGATNGIGLELARCFANDGYDLLIVSRGSGLEETREMLEGYGVTVTTCAADLTQSDEVDKVHQAVIDSGRSLDAAALNAGVGLGGAFVNGTALEDEFALIQINVMSTVQLTKRLLPAMVERGEGRFLLTSSISGTTPIPFEAVYGASKAFINSFFYAVRNEIQGSGVQMTLLLPGPTETNFFHRAGQDETEVGAMEKFDPVDVARDGYVALMSGHDTAYGGGSSVEYEAEVLNRMESEPQKAQRHRLISAPGSANGSH